MNTTLFTMNENGKKPEGKGWSGHGLEARMINHSGGRKQKKKPNKGKDEHSSRYGHSDSYDPFGEEWEGIKADSGKPKGGELQTAIKSCIATHPDKLKRESLSKSEEVRIDEVAKMVGWAVDIVLDPEKRRQYDRS